MNLLPSRKLRGNRWLPVMVLGLAPLLALALWPGERRSVHAASAVSEATQSPDAVCARCHREIYDRYAGTPMARASGLAADGLISGGFVHAASGVGYRVGLRNGKVMLDFDRPGSEESLHGSRTLAYYIGSNRRGRTFLYENEPSQQWFEAPINFYRRRGAWDMAPNFDGVRTMPGPLATDSGCLHCHATEVAKPLAQAANAFGGAPFRQGGIGCAACHGDPSAHLAEGGRGPIVNPKRLAAAGRDSVCLQCHLEGDAMVARAGTSLAEFRPGEDLGSRAVFFVRASRESGGGRASSQYEALLRSACRRGAGDRLTCTTCHDPHGSPPAGERVAWFRARCLTCHTSPAMEQHHSEQQDCAVCHMPTRNSSDISHEQATDHNIQARPGRGVVLRSIGAGETLLTVGGVAASDREFGLAYAQLAQGGDRAMGERAQGLLLRAEKGGADDAAMHTELGFLFQRSGDALKAIGEYRAAVRQNAFETTALGNLAVLLAGRGDVSEAMALLKRVVAADPAKTAPALNLAYLQCSVGDKASAREVLRRAEGIDPDNAALRRFRTRGEYAGGRCVIAPAQEALDAKP